MPRRKNGAQTPVRLPIVDIFLSGKEKENEKTIVDRFADFLTDFFGTAWFLVLNMVLFAFWIFANVGWIPGVPVFDPFPFSLLTTAVSLEAIVLSVIVLMSQKRAARVADVREEVDFAVNVHAEREITKVLNMLDDIQHRLGIEHEDDPELIRMKRTLDLKRIEDRVRKKIKES
jgi:uncharacterized membrane protein